MWGALIEYWYYTGDSSYNPTISQAILSQISPTYDFMMPNQHFDLGNDDQLFWALTALSAAEHSFPPLSSSSPSYLTLAINVFEDMTSRWNTTQCAGGLKWQIFPSNNGYDYKSSIANGGYFQLAARLAHLTGNSTYLAWAETSYDWLTSVGFISPNYNVYDGAGDLQNCTPVNQLQWTYNTAMMLYGTAVLANITTSDPSSPWTARAMGFLTTAQSVFYSPYTNATKVMFEAECETANTCDNDQFSFKAYLSRFLSASARMLPVLAPDIISLMIPTAQAAAQSCSGTVPLATGDPWFSGGSGALGGGDAGTQVEGTTCGSRWWWNGFDGVSGVGQQMSALEAVQGLLMYMVAPPVGKQVAEVAAAVPRRRRR
jgi:mannan endo-1,6-alpha-mannosidase